MIGIVSITIFVLLSYSSAGLVSALPMLAAIALVSQRLHLLANKFTHWSVINSSYASLIDVNEFLKLKTVKIPDEFKHKMKFSKYIELKDISFKYNGSKVPIFNNLNLKISKGSRIGIFGVSGSVKAMIDLVSGLLTPNNGEIFIDEIKPIRKIY